jgi:hypothetical protein
MIRSILELPSFLCFREQADGRQPKYGTAANVNRRTTIPKVHTPFAAESQRKRPEFAVFLRPFDGGA